MKILSIILLMFFFADAKEDFFFLTSIINKIKKKKKLKEQKKQEHQKMLQEEANKLVEKTLNQLKENIYEKAWNSKWTTNGVEIDIRNVPQLSFNQWLTFYNSAPERWTINVEQVRYDYNELFCVIPVYEKDRTTINTFWETPEDLWQFIQWQKEYKKGNAAIFEAERARQLSKLAKCLKQDIATKNAAVKKELAALEEEVKSNMPKKDEFDPIRHLLDFSQQVKEGKVDKNMLYQKSTEKMLQSDGSLVTIIHYGVNDPALYELEVQEIITLFPGKKSPTTEWRIA